MWQNLCNNNALLIFCSPTKYDNTIHNGALWDYNYVERVKCSNTSGHGNDMQRAELELNVMPTHFFLNSKHNLQYNTLWKPEEM